MEMQAFQTDVHHQQSKSTDLDFETAMTFCMGCIPDARDHYNGWIVLISMNSGHHAHRITSKFEIKWLHLVH
jgi:hypothetical protein